MAALGPSPELVGRSEELARLEAAVEAAGSGKASAFVVGGESGVGKSRLLSELCDRVRRRGVTVLVGGCIDLGEGSLPYWPVVDALRLLLRQLPPGAVDAVVGPLRPQLALLLPELDEGGLEPPAATSATAQGRLFDAVLRVLDHLGRRSPVLLVIEDIHWADRSTRDLVSFLLANLDRHPVVVVASYRSDALVGGHALQPLLAELRRNRRAEVIELDRLTFSELVDLLTGVLGLPPRADLAEAIWARSDGNAFFAEELLSAAVDGRAQELPPSLRQILLARVDGLSAGAQDVLRLAAAGGLRVPHDLIAAVATTPDDELLPALRECVAQQVLVAHRDHGAYAFRHSLLREVVHTELLPGERSRVHAAYGRALDRDPGLATGSADAELAYHWYEAGDATRALPAAVDAAVAAERVYAFAEAERHYERALDLWHRVTAPERSTGLDRMGLYERAAESANLAGDHRRAIALVRAVIAEAGDDHSIRAALLRERLGCYLRAAGDGPESLAAYDEAVRLVPPELETAERARVVGAQAQALMLAGRYRESRAQAEAALAVARRAGARAEEGHILATLGFDLALLGDPSGGVGLLEQARAIAEEVGQPDDVGRAWLNLAELLSGPLNRLSEGAAAASSGVERARQLGLERSYGVSLLAIAVNTLFRLGRWDEADRYLAEAMACRPDGSAALDLYLARAKLSIGRGDAKAAREDLAAIEVLSAHTIDARQRAPMLTLEAGLALWDGRVDDAREAVAQGLTTLVHGDDPWFLAPLVWHGLRAEAERAEAARAQRSPAAVDEARAAGKALLGRVEALAAESEGAAPSVRQAVAAYVALCRAEWTRLDGASRPDAWVEAAEAWSRLGQPYPCAYARLHEAEALLARRTRSPAAALALRSAHRAAVDLGAAPLRLQIEELAARARVSLAAPRGEAAETTVAPEPEKVAAGEDDALSELTPRELAVLALVSEGRTNRELAQELFISEKTASVHVSHILAKLGVSSRVQAGAIAYRLRRPGPGAATPSGPGTPASPE